MSKVTVGQRPDRLVFFMIFGSLSIDGSHLFPGKGRDLEIIITAKPLLVRKEPSVYIPE